MPEVIIAPSLLSADYSNLHREIKNVVEGGADWLHIDVMDGHFVKNITIGPPVIKSLRKLAKIPFDVHLMIEQPQRYIDAFADAGADLITFHAEVFADKHSRIETTRGAKIKSTAKVDQKKVCYFIKKVKQRGCRVGIALNPATSFFAIKDIAEHVDLILLMSVWPGFGGQKFIPDAVKKAREIRRMFPELDIEVDGGIDYDTIEIAASYGCNVFAAGTSIFNRKGIKSAISKLRANAQRWLLKN